MSRIELCFTEQELQRLKSACVIERNEWGRRRYVNMQLGDRMASESCKNIQEQFDNLIRRFSLCIGELRANQANTTMKEKEVITYG